jgi:hypothetical protein
VDDVASRNVALNGEVLDVRALADANPRAGGRLFLVVLRANGS